MFSHLREDFPTLIGENSPAYLDNACVTLKPDSVIKSISDYYKTSAFVQAIENRQGLKIACIEEIAHLNGWIKKKEIQNQIKFYGKCEYSNYLRNLIK